MLLLLQTRELRSVVVGLSNSIMILLNFMKIGQIIQKLKREHTQTHQGYFFPLWAKVWKQFKITKLSARLSIYLQTNQLATNKA